MGSKRKNEDIGEDGEEDRNVVKAVKAKRMKGKERVTFADTHRTVCTFHFD